MESHFNDNNPPSFSALNRLEWIETNGIGGWASSTVSGAHTRRYHGLLVPATHPPVGRMVLLSKLEETLIRQEKRWELGANQYPGTIYPQGFQFLKSFSRDLFPEFVYQMDDIVLKKTIAAIQGENTTLVWYEVVKAQEPFALELMPFMASRDYHSLNHANQAARWDCTFEQDLFRTQLYEGAPELFIKAPGATFTFAPNWYHNFEYEGEQERGLDDREDLFTHGKFTVALQEGDQWGVIISTANPIESDARGLLQKEKNRRNALVKDASARNKFYRKLLLAADQFVVQRGDGLKSIIAGYHWFSDWGRDAMIALPGICLSTGRYEDAQKILRAFVTHLSEGMLPNRFPDGGESPEYNTVDATLWLFIAVYRYYQSTRDIDTIQQYFLPALRDILDWHDKGTRYNIHVESDELLYAGVDGVQLTWMDAKVGDWVVTPRKGKAVEINALWYNALKIYAFFTQMLGMDEVSEDFSYKAEKVKSSFLEVFWNAEKSCLYDVVDGDFKDNAIRPNQLFAISLPYALVEGEKANSILKIAEEKLYTPVGLRSLSADHPDYKPFYGGGPWERDGAYHQGTGWSWLLGAYIDALVKVRGIYGLAEAKKVINAFKYHLEEAGVGTISEIFDADPPYAPKGCMAQAWSVGEILRVYKDYLLLTEVPKKTKPEILTA